MLSKLFNFNDYSNVGITLNLICATLWAVSYVLIIDRIRKEKFIEMPIFAAFGNIAWEVLWSTVYQGNLGALFNWGVRLWLVLDIYIVWHLFKYGKQQVFIPLLRRHFVPLAVFTIFAWGVTLFTFTQIGIDNAIGGRSAILLNLVISVLYVLLFLKTSKKELMSIPIAWCKGVGTACYTASVLFNSGPLDHFILAVGFFIFVVDLAYVRLLYLFRSGHLEIDEEHHMHAAHTQSH